MRYDDWILPFLAQSFESLDFSIFTETPASSHL